MELADLINDISWDDFRRTEAGDIWVHIPSLFDKGGLIKFCYRVGLHLKRPMEAIIAKDQFVRMRSSKEFETFELCRLDAERPDDCFYMEVPGQLMAQGPINQRWRPKLPKGYKGYTNPAQQAGLNQQLLGLQQSPPTPTNPYPYGGVSSGPTLPTLQGNYNTSNTSSPPPTAQNWLGQLGGLFGSIITGSSTL